MTLSSSPSAQSHRRPREKPPGLNAEPRSNGTSDSAPGNYPLAGSCRKEWDPSPLTRDPGVGGVVGPCLLDADIGAESDQRAVARLVGDGAVAGSAQVGVGDEPGAHAVRAVRGGVQAGSGDRLQGVDGLRVQCPARALLSLPTARKSGPSVKTTFTK